MLPESTTTSAGRKNYSNESSRFQSFEPVLWNQYFNIKDDIELEVGTFRIYRRGVEGPLLFFIHGGGFSALTWAVLSATITEQVKCQCLAVDMRGHGDTNCVNDDDLSLDTLAKDVIKIIFAMYPTEAPPIILVGHSMGGAVAVHVAHKRTVPSMAGLVVIDVVEGSALNSLQGMTAFLSGRPQVFSSLSHAIEWSVRSSQLRNIESARVSFPGQLKRITTGHTATAELEHSTAIIFPPSLQPSCSVTQSVQPANGKSPHEVPAHLSRIAEDDVEDSEYPQSLVVLPEPPYEHGHWAPARTVAGEVVLGSFTTPDALVSNSRSHDTSGHFCPPKNHPASQPTSPSATHSQSEYTWRVDLMKTQPFWHEWFYGLSQRFLSIPEPKLLLLAGVDRLDKTLTIGQMQGKFQLHIFPKCGHAVQEDSPEKVAECLARFLVRNRFTEAKSSCDD